MTRQSGSGWPYLRGIQTVKEVAYLNMREASAAAALDKLWSDTFLTSGGIDAGNSSGYTYRGAANYDVVANPTVYTKVLAHFDTDLTESQQGLTITAVGGAAVSSAQSKFGGGSLLCDPSGKYVTLADSADYDFASGDFTIEMWFRPSDVTTLKTEGLYHQKNGAGSAEVRILTGVDGGGPLLTFQINDGSSTIVGIAVNYALVAGTWYHIAAVRNGSSFKLYLDGVEIGSASSASACPNLNQVVNIGYTPVGNAFKGYIDELRITKGLARYTAAFTPPSSAFSVDAGTNMILQSVQALNLASNISSVMTFLDLSAGTLVSLQVSTDNGSTWTSVQKDQVSPVPAGSQVKIKVTTDGSGIIESWGIAA